MDDQLELLHLKLKKAQELITSGEIGEARKKLRGSLKIIETDPEAYIDEGNTLIKLTAEIIALEKIWMSLKTDREKTIAFHNSIKNEKSTESTK